MAKVKGVSRRRFLKTAAGTAAAAGFPTIVPATVKSASKLLLV